MQRYIRLTELIYTLLDKVDEGIITPATGAEISFLDVKHQVELCDYIEIIFIIITTRELVIFVKY